MKYNIEIEIDDNAIKESGLDIETYIRQEMGWLEDSGIHLAGMTNREQPHQQASLDASNYNREFRGGVEWHIAKDADLPIAAYVSDKESGKPLIEIQEVKDTSLIWGEYELRIGDNLPLSFSSFDEALDEANSYIFKLEGREANRYPIHELTGNEGIYSLGHDENCSYLANVFWSKTEKGNIEYSLFTLQDGDFNILDQGFDNAYLSIEDFVRDLVETTPINDPEIIFYSHCEQRFYTGPDFLDVLMERVLDKPVRIPTWNQIAEQNQAMRDTLAHGRPFSELTQEAKERAAERNAGRSNIAKEQRLPELGR